MASNITLAALRSKIQFEGDFGNSRVFTAVRIDVMINAKVKEFWDLLLDGRPESLVKTASLSTAAASDSVAFPTDFYRLRLVEILDGAVYMPLRPHDIGEAWRYQLGNASPRNFTYRIEPGALNPFSLGLRLAPTPQAIYTVRVKYFTPATTLTADGDLLDTVNGYDELVKARVIATLKGGREGSDSSWWDREADRQEARIRAFASPLDVGEPMSLSGQAGGSAYGDMYGMGTP